MRRTMDKKHTLVIAALAGGLLCAPSHADPCGMVPPIYEGRTSPIKRTGLQETYVFFQEQSGEQKLGLQTVVIRPSFSGSVDEFGMLIPFPAVPSLRKVPDAVFTHLKAAVKPPVIHIDLTPYDYVESATLGAMEDSASADEGLELNSVRVLKEEAVGMYQIAVLEAGSPAALSAWMKDNGFQYPAGMDKAVQSYVDDKWCFVAVKTRVAPKAGVNPTPGLRSAKSRMAKDASFNGNVQAMGFRFWVDAPVVPMKLSTFNEGDSRNIVYAFMDKPVRIEGIDESFIKTQLSGSLLYSHTHDPLEVRFTGGKPSKQDIQNSMARRNPYPHNGIAKELFLSDVLASQEGALEHDFETREKRLLDVNERLGLRGPNLDRLITQTLDVEKKKRLAQVKSTFEKKTLTVVDGEFPKDFLSSNNLTFAKFEMPSSQNSAARNARKPSPQAQQEVEESPLLKFWKDLWK